MSSDGNGTTVKILFDSTVFDRFKSSHGQSQPCGSHAKRSNSTVNNHHANTLTSLRQYSLTDFLGRLERVSGPQSHASFGRVFVIHTSVGRENMVFQC